MTTTKLNGITLEPWRVALERRAVPGRRGLAAVVSFYDMRHGEPVYGQYVTSYYPSDLLRRPAGALALHLGVPSWTVDAATMKDITAWLAKCADNALSATI